MPWTELLPNVGAFLAGGAGAQIFGLMRRREQAAPAAATERTEIAERGETERAEITARHQARQLDIDDRNRFTHDLLDRMNRFDEQNRQQEIQLRDQAVELAKMRTQVEQYQADAKRLSAERDAALERCAVATAERDEALKQLELSEERLRSLYTEVQDLRQGGSATTPATLRPRNVPR